MLKKLLIILVMVILTYSCSSDDEVVVRPNDNNYYSTGSAYTPVAYATNFVDMLNSGVRFDSDDSFIVKNGTEQSHYIVVWDDAKDAYMAYSLEYYTPGMTWESYINELNYQYVDMYEVTPAGLDEYGYPAWKGNCGYGDVYFEDVSVQTKDLEKIGAIQQELKVNGIADYLSLQFSLSEERAGTIAKLLSSWESLSKNRSLTDADADALSFEIFGNKINTIKDSFKKSLEGDSADWKVLIEKAAEVNDVSPEHMNKIIQNVIGG